MPCIGSRLQPSPKTCRLINPSQRGDRGRCNARSQLRPPAYGIVTAEERPRSRASLGEDEVEAFGSRWMSQKSSCATARRGRFTAALHLIPSMSHGPDRLAAEPGTGKGTEVLGSRRGSAAITNSVKSGGRRSLPTYLLIAGPSLWGGQNVGSSSTPTCSSTPASPSSPSFDAGGDRPSSSPCASVRAWVPQKRTSLRAV